MRIEVNSSKPLYEQIMDYIRGNIQAGEFRPHTRIPSERDLAEQFGVSRMTVAKALKMLEQAGVVYVRIGKGTYISPERFPFELTMLTSFTEEMRRLGRRVSSRVLKAEPQLAERSAAERLVITPGEPVVVLRRVRLADEMPIALEETTLLAALCPNILERHNFARESLYEVLRGEYGVRLVYAEQTMQARRATRDEARILTIETGSPVLHIARTTYDDHDRPVEYVMSAYRGDSYQFRALLRHS